MGYNRIIPEIILKTLTSKKQATIEGTGLHTWSFMKVIWGGAGYITTTFDLKW